MSVDQPPADPAAQYRATLEHARAAAERNVRALRAELHSLDRIVREKTEHLHHEIGALDMATLLLEKLGT